MGVMQLDYTRLLLVTICATGGAVAARKSGPQNGFREKRRIFVATCTIKKDD